MAWKVVCGERIWVDHSSVNNVITSIEVIGPDFVSSGSYTVLHICNTEEEAKNVERYYKTRFVRKAIECASTTSCRCGENRFRFVPMQDFTDKSDIDWSKSINEIDLQLCKKYNLSDDEMRYIAETIKPMA